MKKKKRKKDSLYPKKRLQRRNNTEGKPAKTANLHVHHGFAIQNVLKKPDDSHRY